MIGAGRILLSQWQCESEDRATVGCIAYRDGAVVRSHDLLDDR